MSGHEKKPDPFLEERQEARQQNGVLDAVTDMTRLSAPFGPFHHRGLHFGSTNFEGYDLNDMVDIVESASPELLESAAEALVQARDAIRTAAEELQKDIGGVDWKGESRTAFTKWADSLVKTAEGIADYADVVGTQVMAASSGLASVRKSMPPRDNRTARTTVDDIPEAAQVDGNPEYTAALKAEKDRQEAINQMYRLASYYTVSADTMQSAEEPVFPKMPDVGVPAPATTHKPGPRDGGQQPLTTPGDSRVSSGESRFASAERPHAEQPPLLASGAHLDMPPRQPVGTEINSVGTLPPQEVVKLATTSPVTNVSTGQQVGPPPLGPGMVPPASPSGTGRLARPGGKPLSNTPPRRRGEPLALQEAGRQLARDLHPWGRECGRRTRTGGRPCDGSSGADGTNGARCPTRTGRSPRGRSCGERCRRRCARACGPLPGHLGGAPVTPQVLLEQHGPGVAAQAAVATVLLVVGRSRAPHQSATAPGCRAARSLAEGASPMYPRRGWARVSAG